MMILRVMLLSLLWVNGLQAAWNPLKKQTDDVTGASQETMIALKKFKATPGLDIFFEQADGYAVFPSVAKGGFGIGGAVGKGQVFQKEIVVGSTSLKQLSIGFQLGGQAFSEIIFFKSQSDTKRFMQGNFEFGAQASAVLIKQGVSVDSAYSDGTAVFTIAKGGLMYEASIGGQKFSFEAALPVEVERLE